jgi:hypothetical protein
VWHASIAYHPGPRGGGPAPAELEPEYVLRCERALAHVGDPALGQWLHLGRVAWHLRRRVSVAEAERWNLTVRDVRGTAEEVWRLAPVRHLLPPGHTES